MFCMVHHEQHSSKLVIAPLSIVAASLLRDDQRDRAEIIDDDPCRKVLVGTTQVR